jgi:hypothetical protein
MNIFKNPVIDAYNDLITHQIEQQIRENVEVFLGSDSFELDWIVENIARSEPTEDVLIEELTRKEIEQADKLKKAGHSFYMDVFLQQHPEAYKAFKESPELKGRLRIPLSIVADTTPNKTVIDHLSMFGYKVDDESYKKGIATREIKVGNPDKGIPEQIKTVTKKIGTVLENDIKAPEHIRKLYDNDPYRTGAKTTSYDLMLTHRPEDVYGMSTGRGWSSCAQMRKGEPGFNGPAAKCMPDEINNHTHVAYLLPKGGDVDKDAICRVAFKHHESSDGSHSTLIAEKTVYPQGPSGFRQAAISAVSKLFPIHSGKLYIKNQDVYHDGGSMLHFSGEITPEHVDAAWKKAGKNTKLQSHIISFVQPGQSYKSSTLKSVSRQMGDAKNAAASGDFLKALDAVGKISEDHHLWLMSRPIEANDTYKNLLNDVASKFNFQDSSHMQKLSDYAADRTNINFNAKHEVMRSVASKMYNAPAKTAEDFYKRIIAHDAMRTHPTQKINVDSKHTLGANAILTVAKHLDSVGALNSDNMRRVYFSLYENNRPRGNYLDHVVNLVKSEVPSANNLLHAEANNLRYKNMLEQARSFSYMRPENRQMLSSVMGIDHTKLIKQHAKALTAERKYLEGLTNQSLDS